jgi:hypothetical protein
VLSHATTGALPHERWGSTARSGGAQRLEYSAIGIPASGLPQRLSFTAALGRGRIQNTPRCLHVRG